MNQSCKRATPREKTRNLFCTETRSRADDLSHQHEDLSWIWPSRKNQKCSAKTKSLWESPERLTQNLHSHQEPVRRTLGGTGWWEKHKNSREEGGREGEYSEGFRKLATIKAKNTDSIKSCWWCKDSSIAMVKAASWSSPHMDHVHTTWNCLSLFLKCLERFKVQLLLTDWQTNLILEVLGGL